MNGIKILCSFFISVCFIDMFAQTGKEAIRNNPSLSGGTYTMKSDEITSGTPAPKGYKAFYISHYARHGARYLVTDNLYLMTIIPLEKAHKEGELTELGEKIYERTTGYYYNQAQFRSGDLTELGWKQHQEVAEQMMKAFKPIFKKHPVIDAKATLYPRAIMSMNAFCLRLRERDSRLIIREESSKRLLNELNPRDRQNPFFNKELSPDKVCWKGSPDDYAHRFLHTMNIVMRIFRDTSYVEKEIDTVSFCESLYHFAYGLNCDLTLFSLLDLDIFTPEESYLLWSLDNLRCYEVAGRYKRAYSPIVDSLINTAERDIKLRRPPVRLRFGHDSSLHGIMTLLNINGFGESPKSQEQLADSWHNYTTPMASTLLFVFYKSSSDSRIIFKLILNGKEASLPLTPVSATYYDWKDFTAYYKALQ